MAYESVPVTAGSGTNIAVDLVGTQNIQVVKLDAGADGVSTPVVAGQQTKAASLPVVLASDQGNLGVVGAAAVGAAASGNPVMGGGKDPSGNAIMLQTNALGYLRTEDADLQFVSPNITGVDSTSAVVTMQGDGSVGISILFTGTTFTSASYQFEGSVDGTTWVLMTMHPCHASGQPGGAVTSEVVGTGNRLTTLATVPAVYVGISAGFRKVRVNFTAVSVTTGQIVVSFNQSAGTFTQRMPAVSMPARIFIGNNTETDLVAAPAAGLSIYVTGIVGSNASANNLQVDIKDGIGGTPAYTFFTAANGGGFSLQLTQPWKLKANSPLRILLGSSGNNFYGSVNYYIAP